MDFNLICMILYFNRLVLVIFLIAGPCSYGCLHREAGVERFIETTASIYMPLVFNDSQMVGMCTFLIHLQFQLYANSSGV